MLWITEDKLDRDVKWLNAVLKKEMVNRIKQLSKQFYDVRDLFSESDYIQLTEESNLRYYNILSLLLKRGYLRNNNADNFIMYYKNSPLKDFEMWSKDQLKKSKRLKRRELIKAIVIILVGIIIGLIPTIINLLE